MTLIARVGLEFSLLSPHLICCSGCNYADWNSLGGRRCVLTALWLFLRPCPLWILVHLSLCRWRASRNEKAFSDRHSEPVIHSLVVITVFMCGHLLSAACFDGTYNRFAHFTWPLFSFYLRTKVNLAIWWPRYGAYVWCFESRLRYVGIIIGNIVLFLS